MNTHDNAANESDLPRLLYAVEIFRTVNPDGKLRHLSELLAIALNEGESVRHYAAQLGINTNVASIDLLTLGGRKRDRSPGLGLVEQRTDLGDLRRHSMRLTYSGRILVSHMLEAFRGGRK